MALKACKECGQPVSSDAPACPHCGKKVPKTSIATILVALFFFFIIFRACSSIDSNSGSSTSSSYQPEVVDQKSLTMSQVKLDFKWGTEAGSSIMVANFTVKNNSSNSIKDFEITCNHFAKSGTKIDSNVRTIYEVVKAHSTRKFPNFNMGFIHSQAASSNCEITDLKIN